MAGEVPELPPPPPFHACVLHGEGTDVSSKTHQFRLKCWLVNRDSHQRKLCWELRRLLPSVGYVERNRHTAPFAVIAEQRENWQNFWRLLELDCPERFGQSMHSMVMSKKDLEHQCGAQQEFWVDTVGMLSLFIYWHGHRRKHSDKELVNTCAQWTFAKTACFSNIEPLMHLNRRTQELCSNEPRDGDGYCACMTNIFAAQREVVGGDAVLFSGG